MRESGSGVSPAAFLGSLMMPPCRGTPEWAGSPQGARALTGHRAPVMTASGSAARVHPDRGPRAPPASSSPAHVASAFQDVNLLDGAVPSTDAVQTGS